MFIHPQENIYEIRKLLGDSEIFLNLRDHFGLKNPAKRFIHDLIQFIKAIS